MCPRNEETFIISPFSKVKNWGFRVKKMFVEILPLDPDPGSQNHADPTGNKNFAIIVRLVLAKFTVTVLKRILPLGNF